LGVFETADGVLLVALIALFVVSQLALAWALRDRLPPEVRWTLFALVLVAALIPSFPIALVVLWIVLNVVGATRAWLAAA
jgi:hypothetical protein